MKNVKDYNTFINEDIYDREDLILVIRGQYDELKRNKMKGFIDIGEISQVSDTNIKNLKQIYKDCNLKIVDDRYILEVN